MTAKPTAARHAVDALYQALRRRWQWIRWFLTLSVLILAVYFVSKQSPLITQAFVSIKELNYGWLATTVIAAILSILAMALVQRVLLTSAGTSCTLGQTTSVVLAANAWSCSVPGGPVMASTLTYRENRAWGAGAVVATWQLIMSGVLSFASLGVLTICGFFLVGAKSNPMLVILSVAALLFILWATHWSSQHQEAIEGILLTVVGKWNRWRRKRFNRGFRRVREIVGQLDAVKLPKRDASIAFACILANKLFDMACLWAAALTVGAHPSAGGLMIAYVTAKFVSTVPVTPGGLGPVEGTLITTLVLGGLPFQDALGTMLIYRLTSYLFIVVLGWLVYFIRFQGGPSSKGTAENIPSSLTYTPIRGALSARPFISPILIKEKQIPTPNSGTNSTDLPESITRPNLPPQEEPEAQEGNNPT